MKDVSTRPEGIGLKVVASLCQLRGEVFRNPPETGEEHAKQHDTHRCPRQCLRPENIQGADAAPGNQPPGTGKQNPHDKPVDQVL